MSLVVCDVACASVSPTNGPDGQPGWLNVRVCNDKETCEEKARRVCPGGYWIGDPFEPDTPDAGLGGLVRIRGCHWHMVIKCNGEANMNAVD
jgi:hypothetical protein